MSTLSVTGIQTNLNWEDKKANLEMLDRKICSLQEPGQVVILPEMFSTGFSMRPEALAETMEGETVTWMRRISASKKIILTGSLIIKDKDIITQRENYYNRLIWMLPNGQYAWYDKRHLFAYGEEDQFYSEGSKRLIASVNGWKVNLLVCYDLRFPVWSRQQLAPDPSSKTDVKLKPEFDLLIYVANWPDRRGLAWRTLLQARALENQCYVVGVNRVGEDGKKIYYGGDSMVVDPLGEILYHKKDEEDIFTVPLEKSQLESVREKLPFWKSGDQFKIIDKSE